MAAPMAPSTASGIDADELSDEVRPQDDLFRHVNSRWLATTEIPPDRAAHGAFHMLHDQSELDVRALAEEAAAGDAPGGQRRAQGRRPVGRVHGRRRRRGRRRRPAGRRPGRHPCRGQPGRAGRAARPPPAPRDARCRRMVRRQRRRRRHPLHRQPGAGRPRAARRGLLPRGRLRRDPGRLRRARRPPCCASPARTTPTTPPRGSWRSRRRWPTGHWTTVDSRDALKTHNKHTLDALTRPGARARVGSRGSTPSAPPTAPSPRSSCASRPRSRPRPACSASCPSPTGRRGWSSTTSMRRRRSCPAGSSTPTSRSTARCCRASPSCASGGSVAWPSSRAALGEAVGQLYVARHFPPEHKAHMDRLVGWLVEAYRVDISRPRVDVARDPPAGARQARQVHAQGRLPRPLARLLGARDRPRRPAGQRAAGRGVRGRSQPGQDRRPDRPRRVAHDPADGQRLLQPRA